MPWAPASSACRTKRFRGRPAQRRHRRGSRRLGRSPSSGSIRSAGRNPACRSCKPASRAARGRRASSRSGRTGRRPRTPGDTQLPPELKRTLQTPGCPSKIGQRWPQAVQRMRRSSSGSHSTPSWCSQPRPRREWASRHTPGPKPLGGNGRGSIFRSRLRWRQRTAAGRRQLVHREDRIGRGKPARRRRNRCKPRDRS